MPRARWWVIGALSLVTASVVLLDATGVIFDTDEPLPPAPALELPAALDAAGLAPRPATPTAGQPPARTIRTLDDLLADDALGSSVHAVVAPLAEVSHRWLELRADAPATPASTLKLWTAAATLDSFALDDRLATSVLWDETSRTLVLVGGGDATLETNPSRATGVASLTVLAHDVVHKLRRTGEDEAALTLSYDTSLFTGPSTSPHWEPTYVTSGVIAPVTALMVDQGMVNPPSLSRYPDPAAAAAQEFADLLDESGLDVASRHPSVDATRNYPDAGEVAEVQSPPINDLVERMLRDSDNQLAEALGRLSAAAGGQPASFVGATRAIESAADSRGVDLGSADIVDASGLSRQDALSAAIIVDALHFGGTETDLAPILSGLAVAGFDGTLSDRFTSGRAASAAGLVRAKTGTLTGITAEAGVTTTCDGVLVAYAFVADAVADTEAARKVLDTAAATLAQCPSES